MRTPEEMALEVTKPCPEVSLGLCFHGAPVGECFDLKAIAALIRARDAEVAERARAETLAVMGGECERCVYGSGYVLDGGACPCWVTLTPCRPGCTCTDPEP